MTKIPPEFPAARALEESFRALGEERAQEQQQARRARRRMPRRASRVVIIALTALLLVAVVATGTKVFLGDGGTVSPDPKGLTGHLSPAPAYRQLALATAPDPVQRQPWGLRLFKSANGDTCLALGRVVSGRLGIVRDGRFQELPARTSGMCSPLEDRHIVMASRIFSDSAVAGGRGVLFGIVDRTVTRLRLRSARGTWSPLSVKADGTFLVVRKGRRPFRQTQLVVDGSTGHRAIVLDR
jgi:hypothetical protein